MTNITCVEKHKINNGEQRVYEHFSDTLNCKMRFAVFLPSNALNNTPCPTLYFLSGLTCSEQNVIQKSGFQRFAERHDLIVVCPDTSPRGDNIPDDNRYWLGQGAGFYLNATQSPWKDNFKMYDYVTKEITNLISTNFEVTDKKSIMGHSMGGFGALLIGLTNPNDYVSISAFSPICSPMNSEWGKDALQAYLGDNQADWQSIDPCELIKQTEHKKPILIDQGSDDEFLNNNLLTDQLIQAAQEIDYPCEINLREGYDHSYYFVQSFIAEHLTFHAEYLEE